MVKFQPISHCWWYIQLQSNYSLPYFHYFVYIPIIYPLYNHHTFIHIYILSLVNSSINGLNMVDMYHMLGYIYITYIYIYTSHDIPIISPCFSRGTPPQLCRLGSSLSSSWGWRCCCPCWVSPRRSHRSRACSRRGRLGFAARFWRLMWQCVKTNSTCSSHQNSWDLRMFIPLKMVLIGIDPYPCVFVSFFGTFLTFFWFLWNGFCFFETFWGIKGGLFRRFWVISWGSKVQRLGMIRLSVADHLGDAKGQFFSRAWMMTFLIVAFYFLISGGFQGHKVLFIEELQGVFWV